MVVEKENPLYLPAGSVRAIIALIAVSAAVICICTSIEMPEWFIAVITGIIVYFFGMHNTVVK